MGKLTPHPTLPACLETLRPLAGHQNAYLVGGAVRDILMGRAPVDHDLAVAFNPQRFARQSAQKLNGHMVELGKPGQRLYRVVCDDAMIDVCALQGGEIMADLAQRDFTVNAMAIALESEHVIDPFDGRGDIATAKIRMTSPAVLGQDPVRLLRAFRIAAQMQFSVGDDTRAAIVDAAATISTVAVERVSAELNKLLAVLPASPQLQQMADAGLLGAAIPELIHTVNPGVDAGAGLKYSLAVLQYLEEILGNCEAFFGRHNLRVAACRDLRGAAELKWAVLFHRMGMGPCKTGAAPTRAVAESIADRAAVTAKRLRFSNRLVEHVSGFIRHMPLCRIPFSTPDGQRVPEDDLMAFFIKGDLWVPELILFSLAQVQMGTTTISNGFCQTARRIMDRYFTVYLPRRETPPLISGDDLISTLQLQPSPLFTPLLDAIRAAQLAGRITTRNEGLQLAREHMAVQAAQGKAD